MNYMLAAFAFSVLLVGVTSDHSSPKVAVYSKLPGQFGQANTLICHVSGFHPPDISITLLKDGVEIPEAAQSDLAFEQSWQFHLTRNVPFTPLKGEQYSCRVKHHGKAGTYMWESNM